MMLLIAITLIAYLVWRMVTPDREQKAAERRAAHLIEHNRAQASSTFRRFTSSLPIIGGGEKARAALFRAWLGTHWLDAMADSAPDADTRAMARWANTLSDKAFRRFIGRLDGMTRAVGVSLDTLIDPALVPQVKVSSAEVVRLAALAVWKAETSATPSVTAAAVPAPEPIAPDAVVAAEAAL